MGGRLVASGCVKCGCAVDAPSQKVSSTLSYKSPSIHTQRPPTPKRFVTDALKGALPGAAEGLPDGAAADTKETIDAGKVGVCVCGGGVLYFLLLRGRTTLPLGFSPAIQLSSIAPNQPIVTHSTAATNRHNRPNRSSASSLASSCAP
jgi:hypothetical protein